MPTPVLYWWTCPRCLDRMQQTAHADDAAWDRDQHIAASHPDWTPTEAERRLCCWPPNTEEA